MRDYPRSSTRQVSRPHLDEASIEQISPPGRRAEWRRERTTNQYKQSPLVSYNIWRSSQTRSYPSTDPVKKIFREIGTHAEIRDEKRRLVKVLKSSGEERWVKQADKVNGCRRVVRFADGVARCEIRSCSNRWCSYCGRKQAKLRAEDLSHAFCAVGHHYPSSKYFHAFITLTIDDRRLPPAERTVAGKVKAIRKELTRFLNQRVMKNELNLGCYYKIETTFNKKSGRANVHAHMVMVCGGTRRKLEIETRRIWALGKIIQVKKFKLNGLKGIYEISKGVASYLQKSWDIERDDHLLALVKAFHNVKINGATGCIRAFLKDAKKYREENRSKEDIKPPPEIKSTPDIVDGRYDRGTLLVGIAKGSQTCLELLKLLEYRILFGFKYEDQQSSKSKGESVSIGKENEGSLVREQAQES